MGLSSCFFSFIHLLFWLSLFHLTLLAHFTFSMKTLCYDDERSSLLQFKESLIINKFASSEPSAYPKVASWKVDKDCCSWDGVTCNEVTGHLIELDLTSSYLYGSINSSSGLFHLVHLERLSLADNDFNDSKIPSEIKNLSRLTYLDLYNSSFSGQIPWEVLELSNLEALDLTFNFNLKLQKPGLRNLVEKLTHLKVLHLGHVNISSPVPEILANLSSLTELSLKGCQLQGKFPTKIFQLPNLRILSVRFNPDLFGSLPEFEKNNPLEELRVQQTRFSGEIPYSIGNLNSLQILDLSNCRFWGSIPPSLGNLTKITYLDLNQNAFSGELPATFGNLTKITHLDLHQNAFSGELPATFGNLTKITHLDLHQNAFSGELLAAFGSLTKITYLDIHLNAFSGELSVALGNLSSLEVLDISSNDFSSQDSSSYSWIAKYSKLTLLSLTNISLVGEIPSWIMSLTNLTDLYMAHNNLNGTIPSQISNLRKLNLLALDLNQLQGPFPSALFDLENLQLLYLESNNLSGTVDMDMLFYKLRNLRSLALSSNNLSLLTHVNAHIKVLKFRILRLGSCNLIEFPNFLRDQDQLEDLDLSSNKLVGQIPRWFFNLSIDSLQTLDLSNNLLRGFD